MNAAVPELGRPHSISYEPLFAKVGLGQFCGGLVDARALNNNQLRGLRDTSGFQHVPSVGEIDFDTAFLGAGDMRGAV